jgi:hypothetical protein
MSSISIIPISDDNILMTCHKGATAYVHIDVAAAMTGKHSYTWILAHVYIVNIHIHGYEYMCLFYTYTYV